MFLEPSAGNGVFYNLFPQNKYGIDLNPQNDQIIKMDFFNYLVSDKNVITIGNPPFGKNSSLAVKFFNHAAQFSNMICFIVPKTFQKYSIKQKLNNRFFLQKLRKKDTTSSRRHMNCATTKTI